MNKKQRKRNKQIKLANKKLIREYPFLRPDDKNYDYSYTMLIDGGWLKLEKQLCAELRELLIKANYLSEFKILQIKEKFGFLNVYSGGVPEEIYDEYMEILSKYETLSERTCCECGKPAKMCNVSGWHLPYCEKCMRNMHKISGRGTFDYKKYTIEDE